VSKQGRPIANLSRGQFVAELSFLSHERASADVVAVGELRYNSWNQDKLRSLEKINPELYQKLQHILSRDVTDKIKTTSDRMGELG
jgi:CRP-like cAMP-binding protein